MTRAETSLPAVSGAASAARALSLRATQDALRDLLAEVAAEPARLVAIAEACEVPVIAFTAERRILVANAAAEAVFGHARHGLDGASTDALVPPRLRQPDAPAMTPTPELMTVELPGLRADGGELQVSWTFGSVAHAGAPPIFVMIVRSRRAIEEALEALRQSEDAERQLAAERAAREAAEAGQDRLRRLHRAALALSQAATVDEVTTAVVDVCRRELDADAAAVYVLEDGPRPLRLLGTQGHAAETIAAFERVSLDAETPHAEAARLRAPLFFERVDEAIARFPALADRLRGAGYEAVVTLPLIARGVLVGVASFRYRVRRAFDEADRAMLFTMAESCAQALDRALLFAAERRARADAEAANRSKDEFLAMLGHELRNPLAPISTAIQLMRLRGDGGHVREREIIERQLAHITRLVDDLLDVSRITRGKLELARTRVDIADALTRAVEMASPLFEQRGHALTVDAPPGLFVHGDAARLAQVVANLLTNAAKYTPPRGHVALTAAREDGEIVIRVRDDGEGIAPELLERVFELFVQGKRTFDRSAGGLGIGLALVRSLVGLHGGTVSASSPGPGLGSELVVRLPAFAGEPSRPVASARTAPLAGAGKRVLVVDDNRDWAEMLSAALADLGYQVAFALDGPSALDRLREFEADAAVLDLGLPVLDGFELARRIRAEHGARAPRLIALTGYGQPHDRARSRDAGFAAHLVKPVELGSIVRLIEEPAEPE